MLALNQLSIWGASADWAACRDSSRTTKALGTWPRSPELLWDSIKSFPEDEIEKITWRNAARFLDIDPFARIARSDATVGALRAKAAHVDISPIPGGGLKPVASGSVLSTADIYAMYQQGDARLGEPVGYLA